MFFIIKNTKVLIDYTEWEGMNEIKLINTNEGLVLEFCNECITDEMYKKMLELYKSRPHFFIDIHYKKQYEDGSTVDESKKLKCKLPEGELMKQDSGKSISDLNFKALIREEMSKYYQ